MREKTLNLLGLMRRANALQVGETNAGAAVRGGKAKLLLLASDASDNARGRAEGFLYGRNTIGLTLPFISYGGSSIVTLFAAMGMVSGIQKRTRPEWLR